MVEWKTKRRIFNPDPKVLLVGWKWWEEFKRHNPELETKVSRKWPRNRANHCHAVSFTKLVADVQADGQP